ncbi:MAG: hypothetical protein Q9178_003873 [Gyalolechia marmorata]
MAKRMNTDLTLNTQTNSWEIEKMHKEYGPIVRISPYELHINDLEYYDELYVGSSRRSEKYPWTTKQFGPSTSVFATVGHELHRIRRAALAPFFSTQAVQRLEPCVQSVIDKLITRLHELQGTGKVVDILHVYCALTLDIISEYSFARAYGALDRDDFGKTCLGNGVSHRLARISPDVDLQYKNWTIPRGVPVSMTALLLHADPTFFPSPTSFSPDRWLSQTAKKLEHRYLVTFGKGSRMCIGMSLAYCELYLTLFAVFARSSRRDDAKFDSDEKRGEKDDEGKKEGGLELELWETGDRDVVVKRDFFNAVPELGTKGIRVVVK